MDNAAHNKTGQLTPKDNFIRERNACEFAAYCERARSSIANVPHYPTSALKRANNFKHLPTSNRDTIMIQKDHSTTHGTNRTPCLLVYRVYDSNTSRRPTASNRRGRPSHKRGSQGTRNSAKRIKTRIPRCLARSTNSPTTARKNTCRH